MNRNLLYKNSKYLFLIVCMILLNQSVLAQSNKIYNKDSLKKKTLINKRDILTKEINNKSNDDIKLANAYYDRGDLFLDLKNYDDAIEDYIKALKIYVKTNKNKNINGLCNNLGIALLETKRYDESMIYFNLAIKRDPRLDEAYDNRGNLYMELNKYQETIDDYTEAIKIKPNVYYFADRGYAYVHIKNYDMALKDINKAIKRSLSLISKGEVDSADLASEYQERGYVYTKLKKIDEALKDYHQAINYYSQSSHLTYDIYLDIAEIHICNNDYNKALESVSKAENMLSDNGNKQIALYLNILAKIMLNKDYVDEEKSIDEMLEVKFDLNWNFDLTDEWLSKTNLSEGKKLMIQKMTLALKKHKI